MFKIYTDEAGTSGNEDVTVVSAVIFDGEQQMQSAKLLLDAALDFYVPDELRSGFIFHATDVLNRHRGVWTRDQRCEFIETVASIPRRVGAAIALGKVRRDSAHIGGIIPKMSKQDFQHAFAFWSCLARANKYIGTRCPEGERATVVAEYVAKKQRILNATLGVVWTETSLDEENIILTKAERESGIIRQTNPIGAPRLEETVNFVKKEGDPLLQLADASAFSFRRYFAGQSMGDRMVTAMLGYPLVWDDWQGPASNWVFPFSHPGWSLVFAQSL